MPTRPGSSRAILAPPKIEPGKPAGVASVGLARTHPRPFRRADGGSNQFQLDRNGGFEARPSGNAVSLEDEMLKVAEQPDGLPGGDRALHPRARHAAHRDRQALRFEEGEGTAAWTS